MKSDCRTFLIFISFSHFISLHLTWLNCANWQLSQVPSGGRHITGLPFIAFYFFTVSVSVFFFFSIRTRVVLAQHFRSPADLDWFRHFSPLSSGYTETGALVMIWRMALELFRVVLSRPLGQSGPGSQIQINYEKELENADLKSRCVMLLCPPSAFPAPGKANIWTMGTRQKVPTGSL